MRLAITFWGDKCYREGYPDVSVGSGKMAVLLEFSAYTSLGRLAVRTNIKKI